ncbi:hypothetical protein JVT61DRAFT_14684 [Boletus reticuloceps]|uniref:Uncharacterized protein n=1 Tax=Boletus reticuloceps TaxID=495285 RepID=A0A8I3AAE6_9AGAM|nr:hypothetical protein JVT61DRAFT_14684 [Boletus reticuloceps]
MADLNQLWVVLSKGDKPTGICTGRLTATAIKCGRATPPLPIAIQCLSMAEARALYFVVQPVVAAISSSTPTTTELLSAFEAANDVRNFFAGTSAEFYAVIVGSPPGIHRSRESAERSQRGFTHSRCLHVNTFWEALASMIVKGIQDLMPPSATNHQMSPASAFVIDLVYKNSVCTGTPSANMAAVNQEIPEDPQVHTGPSQRNVPSATTPGSAPAIGSTSSLDTLADMSLQTVTLPQANHGADMNVTTSVYVHIRTLRGITDSETTLIPLGETRMCILGRPATDYLHAHRYTAAAVDFIIHARQGASLETQFALQLATQGMAYQEAIYLYGLMQ